MRVAVIVKSLQMGGMERAAINLAETFANEGHQSHLIYFKKKRQLLSPNENVHVHLFNLEKSLKYTVLGAILYFFAKIINGILRHSFFYFQGFLLTPFFRNKLQKIEDEYGKFDLIIIRGQGTFEMIWPFNDKRLIIQQVNVLNDHKVLLKMFFRKTIFSNKNIVCNAPSVLKELKTDFINSKVNPLSLNMIPSPINLRTVTERANEYEPDFNKKYIVNVGRLVSVKNITLLIDAFYYARKNLDLKHHLVIIGDGNLRTSLEEQAKKLNIENYIYFTGIIKNPYPWLKKADMFAFTSKNEGLPNVLLESLACHTTIASTKGRGGTLDIMSGDLKNNLTNFNAKEFAIKIVNILKQSDEPDYNKHLKKYSPPSVVEEYIKYIKKV